MARSRYFESRIRPDVRRVAEPRIVHSAAGLRRCGGRGQKPGTKDRQARMAARRYQDGEDTLAKTGPELGLPSGLQKLIGNVRGMSLGEHSI